LSTRNIPVYRDPSALLLDQIKEIWIDSAPSGSTALSCRAIQISLI